jgi:hypothetical protein
VHFSSLHFCTKALHKKLQVTWALYFKTKAHQLFNIKYGDFMEFLSSVVLSGFLYDMLKHGVSVTSDTVKTKLKDWAIDEVIAPALSAEISKLNLTDELSESAIEKRISQAPNLVELINSIKKDQTVTNIIQSHSGNGDNIGRDKITN